MFLYLSGCVCCNPKVVSFNLPNDSWTRLHHLHHAPFTSAQNFLLFLFVWWWFGEGDLNTKDDYNPMWKWFVHLTVNTHLNIWGADFLAIKATHSFDGAITIFKMYKGIVFNLLYSFHFAILLKLFLHKYVINQCNLSIQKIHILTFSFSSVTSWVKFRTYSTFTFDIVCSSGSSCGSAQSTIISHPQTCNICTYIGYFVMTGLTRLLYLP